MALAVGDNNAQKQNKKLQCGGCYKDLNRDHTGVVCLNSHNFCAGPKGCAQNYVNVVLGDPDSQIPLKCSICKAKVVVESFERQLTEKQLQTFLLYNMKFDPKFLDKDEVIASCPFCQYWEINTVNDGRLMFLCNKQGCKKSSCFWCKKEIKNKRNVKAEAKVDIDEASFEEHFECAALAPHKEIWDKALESGGIVPCPECGIGGQKDGACTHMRCVKCQTEWCYLCGKASKDCDKRNGVTNMMGHNNDWRKNALRCPLFLDNLVEIDKRWPPNNNDSAKNCVAFLHQLRTKQLLKEAIKKMGNENYVKLCKKYFIDTNCGFDIKNDVLTNDHTLVIRK